MIVITSEELEFAELMLLVRGRCVALDDAIDAIYEQAFASLDKEQLCPAISDRAHG
jgi:hypothetical protein